MAYKLNGLHQEPVRALFPGTCTFNPISPHDRTRITSRGNAKLSVVCEGNIESSYPEVRRQACEKFLSSVPDAVPFFINIVNGHGVWRLPFEQGHDVYTKDAHETIACMMMKVHPRWDLVGIGIGENEGDLILSGPLTDHEIRDISQEKWPLNLGTMGRPGPGVCGRPLEAKQRAIAPAGPPLASNRENHYIAEPANHPLMYPPDIGRQPRHQKLVHEFDYPEEHVPHRPRNIQGPRQPQGARQPRPSDVQAHRPYRYKGRRAASSSDSSTSSDSDSDSASSYPQYVSPKRAPKKTNPKGRAKGKPKQRPKQAFEEDEADSADDRPKRRAPPRGAGRRRERSDDKEVEAPARRLARGGAPPPKGQGRRNRERELSDDDEEAPPLDPVLEALKEKNGYGKVKGKDEKSGWH
ncbi:MAG: hypothetical protein Q9179_006359 [Wetmoreana sp. 5 TL-2023]